MPADIPDADLMFFRTACFRAARILRAHQLGANIDDLAAKITLTVAAELGKQMTDPSPEVRAVLDRYAAYEDDPPPVALLKEAMHLRMNGEYAPGGRENWPDWDAKTEAYLMSLLPAETTPDVGE